MKRAAVLNSKGKVVNVIMADAAKDAVPGMTLVAIDDASPVRPGYVYRDGAFALGTELAAQEAYRQAAREAAREASLQPEAWEGVAEVKDKKSPYDPVELERITDPRSAGAIFEAAFGAATEYGDFAADAANYVLANVERTAVIAFVAQGDHVYEGINAVTAGSRARGYAARFTSSGVQWMFENTDCLTITSHTPAKDAAANLVARSVPGAETVSTDDEYVVRRWRVGRWCHAVGRSRAGEAMKRRSAGGRK